MCKNWNFTGETKNIFAIEAGALIFLCGYIIQVLLMGINGLLCNLKYIAIFMRNLTKTKKLCTCQVFTVTLAHMSGFDLKLKRSISQQRLIISHAYTDWGSFYDDFESIMAEFSSQWIFLIHVRFYRTSHSHVRFWPQPKSAKNHHKNLTFTMLFYNYWLHVNSRARI